MDLKKLDEIIEHADLIQKLTRLIPIRSGVESLRVSKIITEAEMIKNLIASLKEKDYD